MKADHKAALETAKSDLYFDVANLKAAYLELRESFEDRCRVIEMQLEDKEELETKLHIATSAIEAVVAMPRAYDGIRKCVMALEKIK